MTDSPSRAIPLSVVGGADTLQPGAKQLAGDKIGRSPVQFADAPVLRYWTPEEFAALEAFGLSLGFSHVASGPLVRSSYHADQQAAEAAQAAGARVAAGA